MAKNSDQESTSRIRSDRRRPLLVYLDPDLIKNLKKAALDDERHAYEIVEDSVRDYLDRRERVMRGPLK